jgi:hypothetical protein
MPSKSKKSGGKPARRRTKPAVSPSVSKRARAGGARAAECAGASARFVEDLLVRGEAVKPTKAGKLPLEATHAIVKENPDGTVEVRRARYRTF